MRACNKTFAEHDTGLQRCLDHLKTENITEKQIDHFFSWPQCWPDDSCGFDGIAAQSITTAQTIVLKLFSFDYSTEVYYVYHDYSFAYKVVNPSAEFVQDFFKHKLAGAMEYKRIRAYSEG